jgi:hypothetical protein
LLTEGIGIEAGLWSAQAVAAILNSGTPGIPGHSSAAVGVSSRSGRYMLLQICEQMPRLRDGDISAV